MSQGNAEVVERIYAHWSRGEFWAAQELYADDVEFSWSAKLSSIGEGEVLHGLEALSEALLRWFELWDEFRVYPDEFIDPGGEQVIVPVRHRGRSKSTGVTVEGRLVHLWTIRNGRVAKFRSYDELDEAFKATELSE